jgi:hypothetical protein
MLIADLPRFLGQSPEVLRVISGGFGREEKRFGCPAVLPGRRAAVHRLLLRTL